MITVKTQAELDAALEKFRDTYGEILIDSPRGVWLKISSSGSATVSASGSATVRAYDSATVRAGSYVAVHLHSAQVTVEGGVVIDVTKLDRSETSTWADYHGATITDGEVVVYKAVDSELKSGRGFAYPIGESVEDPDWRAGDFCGNGLHFSPHPHQAAAYFPGATRFLECAVSVAEVSIIDGNGHDTPKLKAKSARVIREVTIDGLAVSA